MTEQYGWMCPRCNAVNAPWVAKCDCSQYQFGGFYYRAPGTSDPLPPAPQTGDPLPQEPFTVCQVGGAGEIIPTDKHGIPKKKLDYGEIPPRMAKHIVKELTGV